MRHSEVHVWNCDISLSRSSAPIPGADLAKPASRTLHWASHSGRALCCDIANRQIKFAFRLNDLNYGQRSRSASVCIGVTSRRGLLFSVFFLFFFVFLVFLFFRPLAFLLFCLLFFVFSLFVPLASFPLGGGQWSR